MLLRSGGPLALYRNHLVRGYLDCFVNGSLTATEYERAKRETREARERTRRKRITMGSMDGYAMAGVSDLLPDFFSSSQFDPRCNCEESEGLYEAGRIEESERRRRNRGRIVRRSFLKK